SGGSKRAFGTSFRRPAPSSQLAAPFSQQGPKLVDTGALGHLGVSVSLSANGSTAIVANLATTWGQGLRGGTRAVWTLQARLVDTGALEGIRAAIVSLVSTSRDHP